MAERGATSRPIRRQYFKMAEYETEYSELFRIEKDPSKSFNVNVSECLETFLHRFVNGDGPADFTGAAMVLQAACSGYGRKVEYLYTLTSSLCDRIVKPVTGEQPKKAAPAAKKERKKKTKKADPLCSVEVKYGKSLSCLDEEEKPKKPDKRKKKVAFKLPEIPIDLIPLENQERGEIFFDTNGEEVGHKYDFIIHKCRLGNNGWLLAPSISDSWLDQRDVLPRYIPADDSDTPYDEGYAASSGCPSSPPSEPNSQVPCTPDEGLGMTPCEAQSPLEDMDVGEDVPMEGVMQNEDPTDVGIENIPAPGENLRARPQLGGLLRPALQETQLNSGNETPNRNTPARDELVAIKKPIEKKSTVIMPSKLNKANDENRKKPVPASVFCARTFFALDEKFQKSELHSLATIAFAMNSKFVNQINRYKEAIKAAKRKRKESGDLVPDEDEDIEVGNEELRDADSDSVAANPGLEYDDFEIHNSCPPSMAGGLPLADEIPMGDGGETGEEDHEVSFARLAEEQTAQYQRDIRRFQNNSDLDERVREWRTKVAPFLAEIKTREPFDINDYGSQILEWFPDPPKSSKAPKVQRTFKEFCVAHNLEKWQIHRYFMALLPLANMNNVLLGKDETKSDPDDDEDITITLLSKEMQILDMEKTLGNSKEKPS